MEVVADGFPLGYDDERQRRAEKKLFRRRLNAFLAYALSHKEAELVFFGNIGGYILCTLSSNVHGYEKSDHVFAVFFVVLWLVYRPPRMPSYRIPTYSTSS